MLKVNQFGYGTDIKETTQPKFGESSIPMLWEMKLIPRKVKEAKDLDSLLMNHST
jgi:hypothetical protein